MKHLSLQKLEMVSAGRNIAYASVEVAGHSMPVPYFTAKSVKKVLEKTSALSVALGYAVADLQDNSVKAENFTMKKAGYAAAALGIHMLVEDNIDEAYKYFGLDTGSDK